MLAVVLTKIHLIIFMFAVTNQPVGVFVTRHFVDLDAGPVEYAMVDVVDRERNGTNLFATRHIT